MANLRIKPVVSMATAVATPSAPPVKAIARAIHSKREGGGPIIATILAPFHSFTEGDRNLQAAQVNMNGDMGKHNPYVLFVPVGLENIPKTGEYHIPAAWHGCWYMSVKKVNTILAFGDKNTK